MEKKKKKWKIAFAPGFKKSFDKCFSMNPIYSVPRFFMETKYKIKHAWQRAFRGHDDSWYWDLYGKLDNIIPICCRKLKEGHGCPHEFFDKDYKKKKRKNECYQWSDILEKIALGFEANKIIGEETLWKGHKPKKFEKLEKRRKEGSELFVKHYNSLWD